MNYSKLFLEALRATWKHRWMWLIGMSIISGGSGFSGGNLPTDFATEDFDLAPYTTVQDFWADYGVLIIAIIVSVLVLTIVAVVCHFIALGALYWGAQWAREGKRVRFWAMVRSGLASFWKNAILGIGLWFGMLVIVVVMAIPAFLLALTGIGWIILIPFGLFLLVLILPLSWVFTAWYVLTTQYITLQHMSIWEAMQRGWMMFRSRLLDSLVVFGMQLVTALVFGVFTFVLIMVVAAPVAFFGYFAYTSQAWLALGLAIAFAAFIIILLSFAIKGIQQSFLAHLWHGFYANGQEPAMVKTSAGK